jgi:acetyl/propionyl-CoA carboxylase alpha subunit
MFIERFVQNPRHIEVTLPSDIATHVCTL